MIEFKIDLKETDFNKNGELKKSAILSYMQNGASRDAEQFGASHENLLKDNMFFAVYRNMLKIEHSITKDTKSIVLLTFQSNHDKTRFMRSYFIYSVDDSINTTDNFDPYKNALIYCNSIWILMDINKRSLIRSSSLNYPVDEYTLPFERPLKIDFDRSQAIKLGEFKGNQYYIDENGHINNAVYADIADDFTTLTGEVKFFDMVYEHEIFAEETVEVLSLPIDNGEKLLGIRESDNAICFSTQMKV